MRKILTVLLFCAALGSAACRDREAREYAQRLADALKTYKAEINKKIAAEGAAANEQAATYSFTVQSDALAALENDRFRRASLLAENLMKGTALTPAELQRTLADYAKQEFDAVRVSFERESDDRATYLVGVEALALQAQNIDALIATLEEMASPDSDIARIKQAAAFAVKFKQKFDELECQDLAAAIAALKKQLTATPAPDSATKKLIESQIAQLEKQKPIHNCR